MRDLKQNWQSGETDSSGYEGLQSKVPFVCTHNNRRYYERLSVMSVGGNMYNNMFN